MGVITLRKLKDFLETDDLIGEQELDAPLDVIIHSDAQSLTLQGRGDLLDKRLKLIGNDYT